MNATTRILTVALMCAAAAACSKKVEGNAAAGHRCRHRTDHVPGRPGRLHPGRPRYRRLPAPARRGVFRPRPGRDQARLPGGDGLPRQVPARSPGFAHDPGRQRRRARQPRIQHGPGRTPRQRGVVRALQANGGSASQITVVSYGEERPVCNESNEACWSQNRRVEIVYTRRSDESGWWLVVGGWSSGQSLSTNHQQPTLSTTNSTEMRITSTSPSSSSSPPRLPWRNGRTWPIGWPRSSRARRTAGRATSNC